MLLIDHPPQSGPWCKPEHRWTGAPAPGTQAAVRCGWHHQRGTNTHGEIALHRGHEEHRRIDVTDRPNRVPRAQGWEMKGTIVLSPR